jgi:hypothetical protein
LQASGTRRLANDAANLDAVVAQRTREPAADEAGRAGD